MIRVVFSDRDSDEDDTASPFPMDPKEVPDDLKCAICFGIPYEPRVTPCEHVFCRKCMDQAMISFNYDSDDDYDDEPTFSCPSCRQYFYKYQLTEIQKGSLVYRIWSNIKVRCTKYEEGCTWTGNIDSFLSHYHNEHPLHPPPDPKDDEINNLKLQVCSLNSRISKLEGKERRMAAQISELINDNDDVRTKNFGMAAQIAELVNDNEDVRTKNADLTKTILRMNNDYRHKLPVLFDGTYHFSRHDIGRLSQLISRYLTNKPQQIDSNKIFNCIQTRYNDLTKHYIELPPNYYINMRMLLTTSAASNWFSLNQNERINSWLSNQRWV